MGDLSLIYPIFYLLKINAFSFFHYFLDAKKVKQRRHLGAGISISPPPRPPTLQTTKRGTPVPPQHPLGLLELYVSLSSMENKPFICPVPVRHHGKWQMIMQSSLKKVKYTISTNPRGSLGRVERLPMSGGKGFQGWGLDTHTPKRLLCYSFFAQRKS